MSRVKIAEEISFFVFLFRIFSNFEQNIFRLLAKKLQKDFKTTYVSRGKVCDLIFFKFSNVSDFLQKHLAWFTKCYLRVQMKICGRNIFFYSSFLNFFRIWAKIFSDFWPKNFKNLSKLPSTSPEEQFVAWFFLSFQTFRIFCWNIWHGSQNSIYVSRVKIAEKTVFFGFFQKYFEFWAKIFQTFGQKTSKSFQNYILRVQRNSLWVEIFF